MTRSMIRALLIHQTRKRKKFYILCYGLQVFLIRIWLLVLQTTLYDNAQTVDTTVNDRIIFRRRSLPR